VPEHLPPPNDEEPGHDVWTQVPESGNVELRGYYALESDWSESQEQQVERGQDAEIMVVDPELNENGADYGTEDADEDGKFDGLMLYRFQEDDREGMWRAIFTAADNGGIHSPQWRTHDAVRMLVANLVDPLWRLFYITGSYAGETWHGAACAISQRTHHFGHQWRQNASDALDMLLPEYPFDEAGAVCNGGLFDLATGWVMIGAVGDGNEWVENPGGSVSRDWFAMHGRPQMVKSVAAMEGPRIPAWVKGAFEYGRSQTGDLQHSDPNHGGAIEWPSHTVQRPRTFIFWADTGDGPYFFVIVCEGDPGGWTWGDCQSFLHSYIADHMSTVYGFAIGDPQYASMLDGGGSSQFAFKRCLRGVEMEYHCWYAEDRPVPDDVEVCNFDFE